MVEIERVSPREIAASGLKPCNHGSYVNEAMPRSENPLRKSNARFHKNSVDSPYRAVVFRTTAGGYEFGQQSNRQDSTITSATPNSCSTAGCVG
ncbi:hypothetical protein RRG08_012827 [Elysia crispata]|uniref:Uncharacterized protein n=1 Tax=Elysia crispata TaxID=231223 RepID=A0AAE0XZ85_9GAST|nr:hypothetical protein RRG08_012827 [Elysia crispata]